MKAAISGLGPMKPIEGRPNRKPWPRSTPISISGVSSANVSMP